MLMARQVDVEELKVRLATGGALTPMVGLPRGQPGGTRSSDPTAGAKARPEQFRLDSQNAPTPKSGSDAALEAMEHRLRQTELALANQRLESEAEKENKESNLAEVLTQQGQLLGKLLNTEEKPAIRLELGRCAICAIRHGEHAL